MKCPWSHFSLVWRCGYAETARCIFLSLSRILWSLILDTTIIALLVIAWISCMQEWGVPLVAGITVGWGLQRFGVCRPQNLYRIGGRVLSVELQNAFDRFVRNIMVSHDALGQWLPFPGRTGMRWLVISFTQEFECRQSYSTTVQQYNMLVARW